MTSDLSIFPLCDVSFTQNIQQTPVLVRETGRVSLNVPVNGEPEKLKKHGRLVEPSVELIFFSNNNYTKKINSKPPAKPKQINN